MHYRALAVEIEDGLLGSGLEAMLNMTSSSSHNQALHLTAQSLRSFTASELGRYIFRTP